MNESAYRTKICKELRRLGCKVIPIVGTAAGGIGHPDCYVCHRTISFFIEFKGATTKVKKIQTLQMEDLRNRGDIAYILRYPGILQEPDGQTSLAEIENGLELLRCVYNNHKKRRKMPWM